MRLKVLLAVLPLDHPTTVALVGRFAGDVAARIEGRLTPHHLPRAFATLAELVAAVEPSDPAIARVLPAALDDDVRNCAPGDLYVKVRPEPPAAALSVARHQLISVAIIGWDVFDARECARLDQHPSLCQRLALVPRAQLEQAIAALQAGAIEAIVIADAPDADTAVVREIERLAARYFARLAQPLQMALAANGAHFLDDPAAEALVAKSKANLDASSHIATIDPPGVLIASGGEVMAFVLLASETYVEEQRELSAVRDSAEPAPAGFAESGAQAQWADIVSGARQVEGAPQLVSTRIDRDYATTSLFDQILARARL